MYIISGRGRKSGVARATEATASLAPLIILKVNAFSITCQFFFYISYRKKMNIGAKLAVAPVARATPLFLPRPEIIYINVLHFSAPPRTYLVSATPLFRPLWRHWIWQILKWFSGIWMLVKSTNYSRVFRMDWYKNIILQIYQY